MVRIAFIMEYLDIIKMIRRDWPAAKLLINNGNWSEWSAIWSENIHKISKARSFDLKSQVWFQTKIARHEVQLPLYYFHFEIAEFSQYLYFIDQVAGLLKSRNKKAFTSHFVFQTEMMRFRTWMTRFGTDAI